MIGLYVTQKPLEVRDDLENELRHHTFLKTSIPIRFHEAKGPGKHCSIRILLTDAADSFSDILQVRSIKTKDFGEAQNAKRESP